MKTAQLEPERLLELLGRFPTRRIAVLGDFFLDKYLEVDPLLEEPSLETGKPAHQVVGVRTCPGAAGTVVSNLSSLGTGVLHAIGFTGADGEGFELRRGLERLRCGTTHLLELPDRRTPTYLKPRNIRDATLAGEHSRYDTKNRQATQAGVERRILDAVDAVLPQLDALIVMDQVTEDDCGAATRRVREALEERARRFPRVVLWADSRKHIRDYRRVIIKPNQFEAAGRDKPAPGEELDLEELLEAGARLRARTGAPLVITRGAKGMLVSDPEWTLVPGVLVQGEIDPTGAGDSATAGTVLALCSGARLDEAAVVGNLVASITIQQIGTTGVARPEELLPRLEMWRRHEGR